MKKSEYIYRGKVVRVVDGDTIDVQIDLGFGMTYSGRFRLSGIDTAEKNSPDAALRESATHAYNYLSRLLTGNEVLIETYKTDKYGRYLAEVEFNGRLVNQDMIDLGHAVAYFGGKKTW